MKKVYKIILTLMAGYGLLYNTIMAFWIIYLGQKVLFWSFLGPLDANELNWWVPIITIVPLIVFLKLLWKKENEIQKK
jgi:hypothetical protein